MNILFGYIAVFFLGTVLGLIGAGGSILTVPILVYLFGIPASTATGYSLLIVGVAALLAAITYVRRGQASLRIALIFGVPAIIAVYVTRRYLFPAIPDPIFSSISFSLSKDAAVMVVFALFMLAASLSMLFSQEESLEPTTSLVNANKLREASILSSLGFATGIFTGMVGAGGGFMILPVLVLVGRLPMKIAIGTDLCIISAKSLIGFIGEAQVSQTIDWQFIALITLLPLLGVSVGSAINKRVPSKKLKLIFAWFVLVMGVYIVIKEVL